jgi:hypothetical protein
MISIETDYPAFARKCHELKEGESAYAQEPQIPYDIHYYRNGWHAFWKNPPNGHVGRRLRTRTELSAFLRGNSRTGALLLARNLRRFLVE